VPETLDSTYSLPMQLADLTWPKVQALSKDMPVVMPVAALEQHVATR